MRTRVAIDPNVRVRGNETYAGFEDIEGDALDVGTEVEVWEPESNLAGQGRVTDIDYDRELVYLSVDWRSLRERAACRRPLIEVHSSPYVVAITSFSPLREMSTRGMCRFNVPAGKLGQSEHEVAYHSLPEGSVAVS